MKRDIVIEKLEVTVISLFFSFSVAYFVSLWATAQPMQREGTEPAVESICSLRWHLSQHTEQSVSFSNIFGGESHGKERCRRAFEMQHIG